MSRKAIQALAQKRSKRLFWKRRDGRTENVLSAPVRPSDDHEARHQELKDMSKSHNDKVQTPKSVEDIEKWLKNASEHTGINMKKSSRVSIEKFLTEQLPEVFFEKDPFVMEIDVIAKKLLNYDSVLQELQSERLLSEKINDGFNWSESTLENLSDLEYYERDIILATENLPATSVYYNNIDISTNKDMYKSKQIQCLMEKQRLRPSLNDLENYINIHLDDGTVNSSFENVKLVTDSSSPEKFESENSYEKLLESENSISLSSRGRKPKKSSLKMNRKKHVTRRREDGVSCINVPADEFLDADKSNDSSDSSDSSKNQPRRYNTRSRKKSSSPESSTSEPEENVRRRMVHWNQQEIVVTEALKNVGITEKKLTYKIIEDAKIWFCQEEGCNRQFTKLCHFKAHLLKHYGIKPFKCDYEGCSWAFYWYFKLKRHKETHLNKKDFVCTISGCKRRFTTIYNLASHEKRHSRPNEITCQVPDCNAKFQTRKTLEEHMKTHDQSLAPHACNFEGCDKRYYTSNALMSHQRSHNHSETDVTCSYCGKTFDQPCRLKTHLRTHTGHKPYACTFSGCESAFSTSSKLNRHQRKHTNNRKYVCDFENCDKTFMRSEHLKEHKLTHGEKRYYKCHVCSSYFSAKCTLYVHLKKHANGTVSRRKRQLKKKTHEKKMVHKTKKDSCSRVQPIKTLVNRLKKNVIESTEKTENNYVVSGSLNAVIEDEQSPEIQNNSEKQVFSSPLQDEDALLILDLPPIVVPPSFHQLEPFGGIETSDSEKDLILEENFEPNWIEDERIEESVMVNEGSARTALTREHVSRLKENKTPEDPNVNANNAVLNADDGTESFLPNDELPLMYCQEDTGEPYQMILLDIDLNNTINMRDLD